MPGQFYDNALQTQHDDLASVYSSAGDIIALNGPAGRGGRVLDLTLHVTTAFTVADNLVDIGEDSGDVDAQLANFGQIQVGSAIGDVLAPTRANSVVALEDGVDIAADVTTDLITDGNSTAGAADTRLLIAWF
jgi:hypothetical protein